METSGVISYASRTSNRSKQQDSKRYIDRRERKLEPIYTCTYVITVSSDPYLLQKSRKAPFLSLLPLIIDRPRVVIAVALSASQLQRASCLVGCE